jgi:hypothetical protein
MEVVPKNALERFYTVCVLIMALIAFSSFISSITEAMKRLRAINEEQMKHEGVLSRYLNEHAISRALAARIMNVIKEAGKSNKGGILTTREEEVELLRGIPDSLRGEMRFEAFCPTLEQHPFFHEYKIYETSGIKSICRSALAEKTLFFREDVFESQIVTHMVFVNRGSIRYSYVTVASVRTGTDVVMLEAAQFINSVKEYPASFRLVAAYAKCFLENAEQMQEMGTWQVLLCPETPQVLRQFVKTAFPLEEDKEDPLVNRIKKKRSKVWASSRGSKRDSKMTASGKMSVFSNSIAGLARGGTLRWTKVGSVQSAVSTTQ